MEPVLVSMMRGGGCRVFLASSGLKPEMLLKFIQCKGQFPMTKNYLSPNNATVEKPCCKAMRLGMNRVLKTLLRDLRGQKKGRWVST